MREDHAHGCRRFETRILSLRRRIAALRDLGAASIARVVDAYLKETNDGFHAANRMEYCFRIATSGGRNVETARYYIKSIAAETTDPGRMRRTRKFYVFAMKDIKRYATT